MNTPIIIMSFNRPQFLEPVLVSLQAQRGGRLTDREVHLFQDGAINRYSRIRYAADADIEASIELFRRYFPNGIVHHSEDNIGVCENFYRAEQYAFVERKFDCAYFFEDDLVLSPVYLEMMEQLHAWATEQPNVAYFAAYGNHYLEPAEVVRRRREVETLDHHWAFGLLRSQWEKMQPVLEPFYHLVRGTDYSRRRHRDIFKLYESLNASPRASSQDAAKAFACDRLGLLRVNTIVPFAKYIGTTGQHMTPEIFAELGFDRAVMENELISDLQFPNSKRIKVMLAEQRFLFETVRKTEFSILTQNLPVRRYDPVRKCTDEEVIAAYRLFLNRDPESISVIQNTAGKVSVYDLVQEIAESDEHKRLEQNDGRPCNREDVIFAYRLCLHREPDDESVITRNLEQKKNIISLARDAWNSDERKKNWAKVVIAPQSPWNKTINQFEVTQHVNLEEPLQQRHLLDNFINKLSPNDLLNQAKMRQSEGDFKNAKKFYQLGIDKYGDELDQFGHPTFLKELTRLLLMSRNWEEAASLIPYEARHVDDHWHVRLFARAYDHAGDTKTAVIWWTRLIIALPSDQEARNWFKKVILCEETGRMSDTA